jgi:acetyltransferase-like isoleucine patch superfamily enzyme
MKKDIFERLSRRESVPFTDPEYSKIHKAVEQTKKLSVKLNNADDPDEIRELLGQIIGNLIDESTTIFTPFYTNYGKNIRLGKNIFINHACSFLDLVWITIEDNVMIAPRVNLSSESHHISITKQKNPNRRAYSY